MCNVEFMVMSRMYQKTMEEDAKEAQRDLAISTAYLQLSAEDFRRSQEDEQLDAWFDTNNRKIVSALGTTKVALANAGVEIAAVTLDWAQAHVALAGARRRARRANAAAGDYREAEIENVKTQRLVKNKASGTFDWAMDLFSAFTQGIQLEARLSPDKKWDGEFFGMPVGDWMGVTGGDGNTPLTTPSSPSQSTETYGQPDPSPPLQVGRGAQPTPITSYAQPTTGIGHFFGGSFPDLGDRYSGVRLTGGKYYQFQ